MAFTYTRAYLKGRINAGIQNKIGMLVSPEDMMDEAVRETMNDVRMRSTRRKTSLVPNLYNGQFEYAAPSDLHGPAIIDIPQQAKRADGEFNLVPAAQFTRYRRVGDIAIQDYNGTRQLLIDSAVPDSSTVIDALSQLAVTGGTWTTLGDGTNLVANTDDYVKGNGSLSFDINASGGTTAGISLSTTGITDLSNYIGHSADIFVWHRITSITGITNYKLRLGTDSSNYWEFTITARNDGTAFATGWNLFRFDMLLGVKTGSPVATSIKYKVLFMTKLNTKVSELGYEFNYMIAKKGKYADVLYYGKFGWIDATSGAYKEFSTSDTDLLVADTDEFDLIRKRGISIASRETDMLDNAINRADSDYTTALKAYQMLNPSEDKITISTYYDYGSRPGEGNDDGASDMFNRDNVAH